MEDDKKQAQNITEEKNINKQTKKKNGKTRMIIVILFLLIFAGISYIQLRGSYLEYLELGEKYTNIFFTNLKYRYTIMGINFVILYFMIYNTNKGIKKGLKVFFEKEDTNSLTKKYLPAIPIMEEDGYGKKING